MITLTLPWPPSINHYWRKNGDRFYISEEGVRFRTDAAAALYQQLRLPWPKLADERLAVTIALSSNSKRKYDIDNRPKALLDALQKAGLIYNDEQIDSLTVTRDPPGGSYAKVTIAPISARLAA